MDDLKKAGWHGSRISRRRMFTFGMAGMAGVICGFWPALAFGDAIDGLKKDIESAHPNIYRLIDTYGIDNYLKTHLAECGQAGIAEKPGNVRRLLQMRFRYGWHFWDELEFMRGKLMYYIETPLSKEHLNSVMSLLAEFQRDVQGLNTPKSAATRRFRREAARKVRPLYFSAAARNADSSAIATMLADIYPERTSFMGREKLKRLIIAAGNRADTLALPENTGMLCCSLTFLFFGMGAFGDLLLTQWLDRLFAKPRDINATAQWGNELLKNCCADICEWGSL